MADQKPRLMQNGWMMAPDAPRIFHPGSAPQHRPPGIADDDKGEWVYNFRPFTPSASYSSEGSPFGEPNLGEEYIWMTRPKPAPAAAAPVERKEAPPLPATPKGTIYDSWEDYQKIARNDTEGLNRMPFIGPQGDWGRETYGNVPMDPLLALEMFYPGALNEWGEKLRDPLDGQLLEAIAK